MENINKADSFGDAIKKLELAYAGQLFDEDSPILIRIDGKAFHTYTKGLKRPYDQRLSSAMVDTMNYLVDKTGAKLGYTQSDEINLVYYKFYNYQQNYFGSRVQKLVSILASMATAKFNSIVQNTIPEKNHTLALFDARAWSVPTLKEAADVFVWRQEDAIKNAITMAASAFYSHNVLMNKNSKDKIQLLSDKGISWDDFPESFKSGTYASRKIFEIDLTPEMKEYKNNKDKEKVFRSKIENFCLPRLKFQEDVSDFLFNPIFMEHQKTIKEKKEKKTKRII